MSSIVMSASPSHVSLRKLFTTVLPSPSLFPSVLPLTQSPVMSVCFSQFHPNYVVGGTYSGQVVLWDTRSGKRTPVQRSLLSNTAHTYPIYCMELVGSQNAHNLISIATDGRLCSWNLDNLSQPQVLFYLLVSVQENSSSRSVLLILHPPPP